MGFFQEKYDAGCAAIARALTVAAERAKRHKLGRIRIFTDAQVAIMRMTHDEPGPGQTYALQARQAIAALCRQEPAVDIEIRWSPAHKRVPGNEAPDGWAKLAASEPDDHGVEWLARADGTRLSVRPTTLAHLRPRASERSGRKRGPGASGDTLTEVMCSGRKASRTRPPPGRRMRTASRFYQLKSGHALTGVFLKSTENRPDDHCWWYDPENINGTQQTIGHLFKHYSKWKDQQAELWARVKEATERAERKSRVGGREVQPGGARLPAEYVRWTSGSPGGGELG